MMHQDTGLQTDSLNYDELTKKIGALKEAVRLHQELNQLIFSYLRAFAQKVDKEIDTIVP